MTRAKPKVRCLFAIFSLWATSSASAEGVSQAETDKMWTDYATRAVVPAEDLGVLSAGQADYVLIFDWRFQGNFSLTAKQYKALPLCTKNGDDKSCYQLFRQSYSGWLVNRNLEAVRFYEDLNPGSTERIYDEASYQYLFRELQFKPLFNIDDGDIREMVEEWVTGGRYGLW